MIEGGGYIINDIDNIFQRSKPARSVHGKCWWWEQSEETIFFKTLLSIYLHWERISPAVSLETKAHVSDSRGVENANLEKNTVS